MKRNAIVHLSIMLIALTVSSCDLLFMDDPDEGAPPVSGNPVTSEYDVTVTNYVYAPLRNVEINGVAVGAFETAYRNSPAPVDVTIPRDDSYTLSAEIDSSQGEIRNFTYEIDVAMIEEDQSVVLTLPNNLIALLVMDTGFTRDDPAIDLSYGSFTTSVSNDRDRFLGVFTRLDTTGQAEYTWSNRYVTMEESELFGTFNGYYMVFTV